MLYEAGDIQLDLRTFELRRGGEAVVLQRKVFDLLVFFMEHAGAQVSKDEVLAGVWPDELVSESALTWCVSQVRRALGQARGERLPLETVYGRGYRFVLEVTKRDATVVQPDEPVASADPFVGRDAMMQRLQAALTRARTGAGSVCVLRGEAGIGKTRTADELMARARRDGVTVARGRGFAGEGAPALWPWVRVVRELSQAGVGDADEAKALLAELGQDAQERGEGHGGAGGFWLLDRVSRFVREAASATPLLLVLDDLQWADLPSLRLLVLLTEEVSSDSLLVLATLREPNGMDDKARAQLERALVRATAVKLEGLSQEDAGRLLQTALHGAGGARLRDALHLRTGGNPLFMKEALQLLRARQEAAASDEGDPDAGPSEQDIELPPSAHHAMQARLAQLDDGVREVLEVAAVAGASFELTVLEQVTGMEVTDLLEVLDAAVDAGVLVSDPERMARYEFAHELLRETLYAQLSSAQRVRHHREVGLAVEAHDARGRASELALHFHQALPLGEQERLLTYARIAAQGAAHVGAHLEAARFYGWALEALRHGGAADPYSEASLQLSLATSLRSAGRAREATGHLVQVIESGLEHGHLALVLAACRRLLFSFAMAVLPNPQVLDALERARTLLGEGGSPDTEAALLSMLALTPPYATDMAQAKELSARALELAEQSGRPARKVEALRARAHALSGPDDTQALLALADQVQQVGEAVDAPAVVAEAHHIRFNAHLHRGEMAQADEAVALMGECAGAAKLQEGMWQSERLSAMRDLHCGRYEQAEARFLALERQAQALGLGYGSLFLGSQRDELRRDRGTKGALDAIEKRGSGGSGGLPKAVDSFWLSAMPRTVADVHRSGRVEEARRLMDRLAADDFAMLTRDQTWLWCASECAQVALTLRDRERGRVLHRLLAPYAELNAVNALTRSAGAVGQFVGLAAQAAGDLDEARERLRRAVARNEETGHRPAVVRSRHTLARVLLEVGGTAATREAAGVIAEGIELGEALGMAPMVEELRRLGA